MKKFFYLLAVVGVVLTGCKESSNSPENGFGAFTFIEDVSKPIEFDGSSNERSLIFAAQADWSASIQQGASNAQAKKSPQKAAENSATWVTVTPMSGQKGTQQITISCAPNDQNEERSATIVISDGKKDLKITVVQEALSGDFDVFSAIEDKYFKNFCEIYDTDKDGKLSLTEAKAVTEFPGKYRDYFGDDNYEKYKIYSRYLGKITSLKGIKYFTALEKLDVRNNMDLLPTLDVSGMKALTELECQQNHLISLDVSGCTALTKLYCSSNQLTSLDVSGCTALTSLDCSSNQLTSLDVSGCTALTSLDCSSNQLTKLDVSNNTALKSLGCSSNQLTSLDVSNNTALTSLDCASNQLTSLDVSKNTALKSLGCSSNQLTSLDVSKNTALTSLRCYNNQLTSLDVSSCTALKSLYLLPMSTLKTLYLKTEQGYYFYWYYDYDEHISIDDIKNEGIDVIYK